MDRETMYWTIGLSLTLFLGLSIAVGIYLLEIYNSPEKKRIRDEKYNKQMMEKEKQALNRLNLDGIEIVRFADFYLKHLSYGYLLKEYKAVLTRYIPKTISQKATLKDKKNIYKIYVPFEHNIVKLESRKYINASWIPGHHGEKQFIATQIPLKETIWDFWNMVWEHNSYVIIMIGEDKLGSSPIFNYTDPKAYINPHYPFRIEIEKTFVTMDFKISIFYLFKGPNSRLITHIQFLSWTNLRITNPQVILELRRQMKITVESKRGPVVVHCISGCGKTGTFISIANLCDLVDIYKEKKIDEKISVSHEVIRMRENRIMSVANVSQYKIIYDTIIQYIVGGITVIPLNSLQEEMLNQSVKSSSLGISRFERQFKNTNKMTEALPLAECAGAIRDENIDKNRHPFIIPKDIDRPYLKNVRLKNTSDYINAVYVDSFTVKNHFIVTQWPLSNTVNDIWRLLFDKNIQVLVLLNVFENSKVYRQFWPMILNQPTGYGPISVELIEDHMIAENVRCQLFNLTKINIEIKSSDVSLLLSKGISIKKNNVTNKMTWQITIFHLLNWNNNNYIPEKLHDVITLIWLTEEFNMKSGFSPTSRSPIVIMSEDGVKRAGVYCAVAACLERMRLYGDVDVYCSVLNVKRNRPQLITNLNEYLLCYELCLEYLNWSKQEEE